MKSIAKKISLLNFEHASEVSSNIQGKIRAFDGPLTEQLVRQPGRFGLGQIPGSRAPQATTSSVCGFCSTGCSLKIHLNQDEAVNLSPNTDYPVNLGMACPKGWEALSPLASDDRATAPLYRRDRNSELEETDWQNAANIFCDRFRSIQEKYGKESVAFLSTGQICTEEMALLGAFAKFEMGMVHGDGNTRQCMATAVTAYKESFGFDAPPYTYGDFEESDCIVLIGSNLCIAHPIMWQRVLRNKRSPEIIVIDPRKTETAMQATIHVPVKPRSDLVLYYGLANLLIKKGCVDEEFVSTNTTGFAAFRDYVCQFDLARIVEETGLPEEQITKLVDLIGKKERVSFWWTMGVNQGYEATRTAQAIINLALMTGNIGRPGTGANSITGQCNAMGSRLFSNTTSLFGGRKFFDVGDRSAVAEIMGIPVENIPDRDSLAYDQIIDGIESGKIRGLWVIATNGAHSWTNRKRFTALLDKLDFFVVQDMYTSTHTAKAADLLLPAAGWGEKEGTFINSERRIGLCKKVKIAPGQALADFSIFRLLAHTWGSGEWLQQWQTPESAFQKLKQLSRGQPCDFSGIEDYLSLEDEGGIQWPCTEPSPAAERRLFEDGNFFTADRRARFVFDELAQNPEPTDNSFPFVLLTGRGSSAQWHTQTRTGKSAILRRLYSQGAYAEINPADAKEIGVRSGDKISVESRRGKVRVAAYVTPTISRGQIFMPMHYEETNELTLQSVDPHSRQPNYKACAVKIRKA